ncbi:Uncharacterised protein [Candidatus Tiddalikarchaeum anstoanum]|nr:Uncharacterised protein [Candidatus Tiddalikarchaeum anstoanum]
MNNDISKGVEIIAKYIENFFGENIYGKKAAESFKKKPGKYQIATFTNDDKIKAVVSYIVLDKTLMHPVHEKALVKLKLLAGDKDVLEYVLSKILPEHDELRIDVPEGLKNYIDFLKSLGFEEKSYRYSRDLKENLVILSKM